MMLETLAEYVTMIVEGLSGFCSPYAKQIKASIWIIVVIGIIGLFIFIFSQPKAV